MLLIEPVADQQIRHVVSSEVDARAELPVRQMATHQGLETWGVLKDRRIDVQNADAEVRWTYEIDRSATGIVSIELGDKGRKLYVLRDSIFNKNHGQLEIYDIDGNTSREIQLMHPMAESFAVCHDKATCVIAFRHGLIDVYDLQEAKITHELNTRQFIIDEVRISDSGKLVGLKSARELVVLESDTWKEVGRWKIADDSLESVASIKSFDFSADSKSVYLACVDGKHVISKAVIVRIPVQRLSKLTGKIPPDTIPLDSRQECLSVRTNSKLKLIAVTSSNKFTDGGVVTFLSEEAFGKSQH
jgi:hypothetical protein